MPNPVALKIEPARDVSIFSSSVIPNLAQVMYISSKPLPPQQQDVVLLAGTVIVCSSFPKGKR